MSKKVSIKSNWDGDTMSYLVYEDGEHTRSFWSHEEAKEYADSKRTRYTYKVKFEDGNERLLEAYSIYEVMDYLQYEENIDGEEITSVTRRK